MFCENYLKSIGQNAEVNKLFEYLYMSYKVTLILFLDLGCGNWNLTTKSGSLSKSPALATLINVPLRKSCTATIFSPLWLVTSYSCVQTGNMSSEEWVAMAGISDGDPLADEKTQIRMVREVLAHPMARTGLHFTSPDIALVQLDQPLLLGHPVDAACLAGHDIQSHQTCVSVGRFNTETGESINW